MIQFMIIVYWISEKKLQSEWHILTEALNTDKYSSSVDNLHHKLW
jgi:hypothetical protein